MKTEYLNYNAKKLSHLLFAIDPFDTSCFEDEVYDKYHTFTKIMILSDLEGDFKETLKEVGQSLFNKTLDDETLQIIERITQKYFLLD